MFITFDESPLPPHVQYYFGRHYHGAKRDKKSQTSLSSLSSLKRLIIPWLNISQFVIFTNIHLVAVNRRVL
jgi:hypothetical protein